ncbi:hypothetical protein SUGI_0525210 [Cryptomeria japonica]|uniref:uncharacterized protein LOC131029507 n=1 Tax=Cryptomeria japonica TaxID=3369 RepID=UPI002408D18C|nr:uncharacterized protein LOC131029507 [Cryptomeria japonica]GLJ26873.1 hypothetical protein SUGI_0525210 [Cryptomeria japonica]
MSSLDVVTCGSPVKGKQTLKRHTSYEDVLKEFNYEKLCTPSPPSSSKVPPKNSAKICLCAPTKHAGSFRCRLHRAPHRSHRQSPSKHFSVKINNINSLKPSRLSKMAKDTQVSKDIESPSPVMAD